MTLSIMPAFDQYEKEGRIIGRLLAGYGELEFELSNCVGSAIQDPDIAIKVLFRARSESLRIDIADALAYSKFKDIGLENQYADSFGAIRFCRKIRNQFAHCHWYNDPKDGLFFFDLQNASQGTGVPSGSTLTFVAHV